MPVLSFPIPSSCLYKRASSFIHDNSNHSCATSRTTEQQSVSITAHLVFAAVGVAANTIETFSEDIKAGGAKWRRSECPQRCVLEEWSITWTVREHPAVFFCFSLLLLISFFSVWLSWQPWMSADRWCWEKNDGRHWLRRMWWHFILCKSLF